MACVKFDVPAGEPYMFRERNVEINPLDKIFQSLTARYTTLVGEGTIHPEFPDTVKKNFDFCGELYLGHLRYGTSGGYNLSACHPFFRRSSWPTRNLMLAGNFNLTNTAELNDSLIAIGQHPIFATDTQAILERIGFCLDDEHEQIYRALRNEGLPGAEISRRINEEINPGRVLRTASANWDGGYSLVGVLGNGDAFVARDPSGIRPCHWFENDEVVAFASERAPLCTVFDLEASDVHEVEPGCAVIMKKAGTVVVERIKPALPKTQCTFERIYFSPRQRRRHLPRAQGARGRPRQPDLEVHRRRPSKFRLQFHPNTAEVAYFA